MRDSTRLAAIQTWIEAWPDLVPLHASTHPANQESLASLIRAHPYLQGSLAEAVLGLRIGSIDRPHAIVQDGSTPIEHYLHGVVHRIEGDFWNAKYWFRQIQDHPLLAQMGDHMLDGLGALGILEQAKSLQMFDDQHPFSPQRLVDAQAAAQASSLSDSLRLVRQIAHTEWESLWQLVQVDLPAD